MRISDWSSDVCSSDLLFRAYPDRGSESTQPPHTSAPNVGNIPLSGPQAETEHLRDLLQRSEKREADLIEERNAWREQAQRLALTDQRAVSQPIPPQRGFWSRLFSRQGGSEEHTSELQSLMRISYAVFCLKKKNKKKEHKNTKTDATLEQH